MSIDPVSTAVVPQSGGAMKTPAIDRISLQDINRFENAYTDAYANLQQSASRKVAQGEDTRALEALISPLSNLNRHSEQLKAEAESTIGENLKPSELMMLTMHTHQFMFHCQLTANVANRSSDGIQQLFRQQS